jgi:flagellar protein FliS
MTLTSALAARGTAFYRQVDVQSRTPLELVVMLYDGALRFMNDAKLAISRRDIAARREAISRALAIISELQSTLDLDSGGPIAESLDKLYQFVIERLMDASFKQDVRPIEEALRVVSTLRDGWAAIAVPTAGK